MTSGLTMIFTSENAKLRNIVVMIAVFTTVLLSSMANKIIHKMGFDIS